MELKATKFSATISTFRMKIIHIKVKEELNRMDIFSKIRSHQKYFAQLIFQGPTSPIMEIDKVVFTMTFVVVNCSGIQTNHGTLVTQINSNIKLTVRVQLQIHEMQIYLMYRVLHDKIYFPWIRYCSGTQYMKHKSSNMHVDWSTALQLPSY